MVKLRKVYEYWCFESEKDKEDLKKHLGDDLYNDYMKIRDRIPKDQNEYKDFQKLKKLPLEDVQDFVDNFQSESDRRKEAKKGAKKLYEDSDWLVYKITTYPAAVEYGKGTKWCISGNYPGQNGRGEYYFDDYIEKKNLDGGYYFYINKKDPSKKFCVLQTKDKEIDSIWEPSDKNTGSRIEEFFQSIEIELPEVKGINIKPVTDRDKKNILLHNAIKKQNIDSIKFLLKKRVVLSKDLITGDPMLFTAIQTNNPEIVELLLKYKANPNKKDSTGATPLHKIVNSKDYNIVELLLKYGADPNISDSYYGNTPLQRVISKNREDIDNYMVELLLKYGADPNKRINGRSLVKYAKDLNAFKSTIDILKKYGAKE